MKKHGAEIYSVWGDNYIKLKDFSFRYYKYAYIDTKDFIADKMLMEAGIEPKFTGDYTKDEYNDYVIVFCSVKKKDEEKFMSVINALFEIMHSEGKEDYEQFCSSFMKNIKSHITDDEGNA